MEIDEIDRRLLRELQADSGRTNQELADRVHVSPATCLRRVRRLEEAGVIQRRVALVDPQSLGGALQAVCEVTLDRQGAEHLDAFEAAVRPHPAVQQCYRVSAGPDFVLVLAVSGMAAWDGVVQALFTEQVNVRNVRSYFVTRRVKFDPAFACIA
ncbi:MAG: Lrp/AsnC family transcriptional regulator [Burkholderiales bacterium]|nr:Lrp/AsnC family transcriptional regulator [Burkholderiales bacterium]